MLRREDSDTICSVITPPGLGGVSIVRISGPQALSIVRKMAPFLPQEIQSHHIYYGVLLNPQQGYPIDEVLVTYFGKGRSYTGEESIEINSHGNPILCENILKTLFELGARHAQRGEFTYRAFMNGKLDLVQAESVLSLIESQSEKAAQISLRQLKGELSDRLLLFEDKIIWLLAHIEAGIDFSSEDIEVVDRSIIERELKSLILQISEIVKSYSNGRVLRDGLRIALVGAPNVGKSSLLNFFLEEDKAIVSDIPGTTRDVISGEILYDGVKLIFSDTAGLRSSDDFIEKMGVERSYREIENVDVVFFVCDITRKLTKEEINIFEKIPKKKVYVLGNKLDLVDSPLRSPGAISIFNLFEDMGKDSLGSSFLKERTYFLSAKRKDGNRPLFEDLLVNQNMSLLNESALLFHLRHYENLRDALIALESSLDMIHTKNAFEFVAFELKDALLKIQETLGKHFDDQVLDKVFKEFCLGK